MLNDKLIKIFKNFTFIRHLWLIILLLTTAIILISYNQVNLKIKATPVSQIVVTFGTEPTTFNPALIVESVDILNFTYEGLVKENARGEIEPNLAESWQISQDNKQVIYTLRKGLKWSDGKPLTASDVVFTYNEIYRNPAIPTYAKDFFLIGKNRTFPTVRKLDDLRVEFTLPEPFAPFIRATKLEILPEHAFREAVKTKDQEGKPKFLSTWGTDTPPENIIVNGPYTIESYIPSQRVTFRKNPYYWRKDAQGNSQPYIQRVIGQIIASLDTSLMQFRSGGLDYINVNTDYFSLLKHEEKKGKFTIYNGGLFVGSTAITFNLNKGSRNSQPLVDPIKSRWFNTVEFRQAVAYGINRQQILNNIYKGLGELQNSPIAVQSKYYLPVQAGLKVYEYNQKKAKELLLKAGFKYNNKGQLLDDRGNMVRFTLMTNTDNKILLAMGVNIKQDLSNLGIAVDFNPVATSVFIDKLTRTFDWECKLLEVAVSEEPNDWANVWLPEAGWHFFNQESQAGQTPITGRQVADWEQKIGDLYIQVASELNEAKRKDIYAETQRITQEYLPFIYLVNPLSMVAVRNRIQGIQHSALLGTFWNSYDLKLTDE
ncbi:ABC transporter substrate-binding protein [Iningainema tapete]|uniref:ABC transporter substrate-binding protein n=1 Tax=Iningainema tapete BLCC-T55 TaxID=2748662 RepID=A0A8J7CGL3_9CYAN|nr:ABC transporter substrate-binding protein [Iningainema tapete]MBD2776520.1 ABC transporter substrate-binding protein [Iningainema tapete BLCC-T55]